MKKVFVLIAGLSPFFIGYGLNLIISNLSDNVVIIYDIIGVVFLLYWGFLGYIFSESIRSKVYALVVCHLPALIVLTLILFQELINKRYWTDYIGIATQFFYLPLVRVSSIITGFFSMHEIWQIYIVSFALMISVFYLGCNIRDRGDDKKVR